jgi:hypothetical protein
VGELRRALEFLTDDCPLWVPVEVIFQIVDDGGYVEFVIEEVELPQLPPAPRGTAFGLQTMTDPYTTAASRQRDTYQVCRVDGGQRCPAGTPQCDWPHCREMPAHNGTPPDEANSTANGSPESGGTDARTVITDPNSCYEEV